MASFGHSGKDTMNRRFVNISLLLFLLLLLGSLYFLLSVNIKQSLEEAAESRLSAESLQKLNQLSQVFNTHQQDILSLYEWPYLDEKFNRFWQSRAEVDKIDLMAALEGFAERKNFLDVLVFDNQQRLVIRLHTGLQAPLSEVNEDYLSRHLKSLIRAASDHLQISASPFYPSLESLQQMGPVSTEIINSRVSFIVAPLIFNEQILGSIAMARQASDTKLFNHAEMSFADTGQVAFVELGNNAVHSLIYPSSNRGQPQILTETIPSRLKSGSIARVFSSESGLDRLIAQNGGTVLAQWRFVPEFNLGIMVSLEEDEIFASLQQFNFVAIITVISTLLLSLVVGLGYVRNIFSQMNSMVGRLAAITHFGQVVADDGSKQIQLLGTLIDHVETRIQKDDEVLMSAKQRLRFFMKELEDQRFAFDQHCIIVVADADGTFTDANVQFSELSGYSRSELIGSSFKRFGGDYQNDRILKDIFETMNVGKVWQGELSLVKRSGERYWLETTFVPFVNEDGTLRNVVAIHTDITEQKLAYADMIHQAQYDALTGLPNRALLLDRLGQMLRNSRRNHAQVAVLFLDLDDFKKINDSLGHEVGDELLIEVGRRLKGVIRDQDTVGRLGGDEFLVLLNGTEYKEDVEIVARKIIESIREPIAVEEYQLVVGVSIGISIYPTDGNTESELLRHADSAMYNAKKMGRNSWSYFTEAMNKEVARRLEIESWMNGAIDRGEFSVLFQPIVSVMSGKFATVEALVRWAHPQGGNISPDEFIPIAEHSGYIMEIGRFVLEKSLDLAAEWRERYNSDLIVALNASPRQFRDPNWHGGIEKQLAERGLSTRNIEFEITEGVLISGHENVERALQEFSDLGIAISMDDFGTGYSSLSYLRNYPFDTLKIDRSFVADIVEDHGDYELVSAAIAMAHGLGLEVVAEGVETLEQYELLYHRRCDYAQGYLFSPPVSRDAILAMGGRLPVDSRIRQQRVSSDTLATAMVQNGGDE